MSNVVRFEYVVGDKQLIQSNEELEKSIKLNEVNQKEVDQTTKKYANQEKQLKKNNAVFASTGDEIKNLANQFTIAGRGLGDLASGFGRTTANINKSVKAMKAFKVALASSGIGALVLALGAVVTKLTQTQAGTDTLNKLLNQVGATVDVITGRFANLGTAITKFFTGDFKGAAESFRTTFQGIGDEITGAIDDAAKFSDQQVEIRQLEIATRIAVSERNKLIQEQLIITRDTTRSFVEQQQALEKANKLELRNLQDTLALQEKKVQLARDEINFTPENLRTDEQRLALADELVKLNELQTQSSARQRELLNRTNELENKRLSTQKQQTAEMEKQQKALEELFPDEEEEPIIPGVGLTTEQMQEGIEQAIEGGKRFSDETIANAERRYEAEQQANAEQAEVRKQFVRKALQDSKAIALFDAGNATTEATLAAYKAVVGIPVVGPTLAPIAAAAAFAYGSQQVLKIANSDIPVLEEGGFISGKRHSQGGELAELEHGEFVLNRNAVKKYGRGFIESLNDLELRSDLSSSNNGPIIISNNKEVVDAINKKPVSQLNIDRDGFNYRVKRDNVTISQKEHRYAFGRV